MLSKDNYYPQLKVSWARERTRKNDLSLQEQALRGQDTIAANKRNNFHPFIVIFQAMLPSSFTNIRTMSCSRILSELNESHRIQVTDIALLHNMKTQKTALPCSYQFSSSPQFLCKTANIQAESMRVIIIEKNHSCWNTTESNATKRSFHDMADTCATRQEERSVKRSRTFPKRVRFQTLPIIHTIPCGVEMTWLTRRELLDIKIAAKKSSAAIDIEHELRTAHEDCCTAAAKNHSEGNGVSSAFSMAESSGKLLAESSEFCRQRGLERWSSLAHYSTRMVQLLACKTDCFIEQSAQILQGKRDEDRLAEICRNNSRAASQFALLLGQADVAAAAASCDDV
jgi:hypothetical protein